MKRPTWLLVGYGTNVSTPLLVLYRDRLDLGDSATMAIFTVYVFGIFSTVAFAGPVSDRFGRRRIFVPFALLSGCASLVFVVGQNSFAIILLGRFLLGAVTGAALGVGAAWMQELMGPGNEQRAALFSTIVTYAGFGIGPPISALFDYAGVNALTWPFLLHAVITIAAVPALMRIPETVDQAQVDPPPIRPRLGIPPKARRIFRLTIVPVAIWIFAFPSTSFALFPVIVSDSIPDADVIVAAASGALTAWAALLARPIVNRLGTYRSLSIGMLLGIVGYVLGTIAFTAEIAWWVLPAALALGASSGTITASCLGILGELADPSNRGAINSTVFLLAYPGMAMPILLTTAGNWVHLSTALIIATLVATIVLIWTVLNRTSAIESVA